MTPKTKVCKKCHTDKLLMKYGAKKRGKYGKKALCKECDNARLRAYRQTPTGRASCRAACAKYYAANREAARVRWGKWYQENYDWANLRLSLNRAIGGY